MESVGGGGGRAGNWLSDGLWMEEKISDTSLVYFIGYSSKFTVRKKFAVL